MRPLLVILCLLFVAFSGTPFIPDAAAQYMYLDANGDGVWSAADQLPALGAPATVDVWLRTDFNRDGSPAVCSTGDGALTINSYVVNLHAVNGTVTYTNFSNPQPGWNVVLQAFVSNATDMAVGRGGAQSSPPGTYKLFTVTITGVSGTPAVLLVPLGNVQAINQTEFGSLCSGNDFDNTLKLGSDWFDVSGLGFSGTRPVLDQPRDMTVNEGATATQQLAAFDPDGGPLAYSKVGTTPFFMTVSSSGLVTLTPGFTDAGSYTGTVRVGDGTESDQKSFAITVVNVNRCPVSGAGGPYAGIAGAPVSFNGSGSFDPDGDALTYFWNFGDGSQGTGVAPTHAYGAAGTFTVTLSVNDGPCSAVSGAVASISSYLAAIAFTAGGNGTTSLGSGRPFSCVQIQPVAGAFDLADVDLASITMVSAGTGSVSQIHADAAKTSIGGDKSADGIEEITACFRKTDLRLLFDGLSGGRNLVPVTITGSLVTGGGFQASLVLTVKTGGGGALAASVSPNPLNPSGTIAFTTTRPGAAVVRLFDLNGRLVRTLLQEASSPAGRHETTFDGRGPAGERLPSGLYFVAIRTEHDGHETLRVTVLK